MSIFDKFSPPSHQTKQPGGLQRQHTHTQAPRDTRACPRRTMPSRPGLWRTACTSASCTLLPQWTFCDVLVGGLVRPSPCLCSPGFKLFYAAVMRRAVAGDKRNEPRGSRSGGSKEVQLHGAHVAGHNPGHLCGRPEVWSPGRSSRAALSSLIQATRIVTCVGFGPSNRISGPKA